MRLVVLLWHYLVIFIPLTLAQTFIQRCLNNVTKSPDNIAVVVCSGRNDQAQQTLPKDIYQPVTLVANCYFVGCGPLVVNSAARFENVGYFNMTNSAILIQSANVTLFNTTFSNCTARTSGGAMQISGSSTVQINQCNFTRNTAGDVSKGGGSILVTSNSNLTVSNSVFFGNNAMNRGGSLFVDNNCIAWLSNITFERGSATISRGGDVHVDTTGKLFWNGGTSIGQGVIPAKSPEADFPTKSGGSLSVEGGSISIKNIHFKSHSVYIHGAAVMGQQGQFSLENILIENTVSSTGAGAIALFGAKHFNCTNCTIRNTAAVSGGAIQLGTVSEAFISNSYFYNTSVSGTGGGLFTSASTLTISDTIIDSSFSYIEGFVKRVGNLNAFGGGITTQGNSKVTLMRTTVRNCSCLAAGGGIYAVDSEFSIQDSLVENNSAGEYGGAVYSIDSDMNYTDTTFRNNKADIDGGGLLITNFIQLEKRSYFHGRIVLEANKALERGGGMSLFIIGRLTIATPNLVMTGNESPIGSSIDCRLIFNGTRRGDFLYQPVITNTTIQPKIDGVVWFEDIDFAKHVISNKTLDGFPAFLDTKNILPTWKSGPRNTETSLLGLDLRFPDMEFELRNLFNLSLPVNQTEPHILGFKVFSGNNIPVFTAYKGILNETRPSAIFKDIAMTALKKSFTGSLQVSIFEATQTTLDQAYNLTFTIPECEAPNNAIAEVGLDIKNRPIIKCLPVRRVDQAQRIFFTVLATLLLLLTAFGVQFFIRHKTVPIFKASSIYFNNLIASGCVIQYAAVVVHSWSSNVSCILAEWLELTGFVITSVSLIVKAKRIEGIFLRTFEIQTSQIKDSRLTMIVFGYVVLGWTFLTLWTILERPTLQYLTVYSSYQGWVDAESCGIADRRGIFPIISICIHFGLEFALIVASYRVRNVPVEYNDSKSLGITAYVWLLFGGVLDPVGQYADLSPNGRFAIKALRIIVPSFFTVFIIYFPRLLQYYLNPNATVSARAFYGNSNSYSKSKKSTPVVSTNSASKGTRSTTYSGRNMVSSAAVTASKNTAPTQDERESHISTTELKTDNVQG